MKTEKYTLKFKDGTVFKLEFPTDTNQINYDNLNSIFPIQITLGDGREIFLHMYHLQSCSLELYEAAQVKEKPISAVEEMDNNFKR